MGKEPDYVPKRTAARATPLVLNREAPLDPAQAYFPDLIPIRHPPKAHDDT